jgi:hypothetical protein
VYRVTSDSEHAGLDPLTAFVGEWRLEASFAAADEAGRAVFEWLLGGQFLIERAEVPGAPDSIAIVGLNADGAYTQHYFDSRGLARVYAMTFGDRLWTLLRNAPDFTPLDFAQRFTGEFSEDGRTISGRWESSPDGTSWKHDFDLVYTKVGEQP